MRKRCKWFDNYRVEICRRHAPIIMANPNFDKGRDQRVKLTEFPDADCPCGDYEPGLSNE